MATVQTKDLGAPDRVVSFNRGKIDFFQIGGITITRTEFQPGWHWAVDAKPVVGTETCQVHHTGIAISGRLHVRLDDGTETEISAGSAFDIPPGHDGWVVSDDPWVTIDTAQAS
jgi:quercetin dioxygenase-like cupin family protein